MVIDAIIGLVAAGYISTGKAASLDSREAELESRYKAAVANAQKGDYHSALVGFTAVVAAGPTGNPEYRNALNWLENDLFEGQRKGQLDSVRGALDAAVVYATLADSTQNQQNQQDLRRKAKDLAVVAKRAIADVDSATQREKIIIERKKVSK